MKLNVERGLNENRLFYPMFILIYEQYFQAKKDELTLRKMKERQAQARDKKNSFPHFPPLCVCVMNIERSNEQHCTFLSK